MCLTMNLRTYSQQVCSTREVGKSAVRIAATVLYREPAEQSLRGRLPLFDGHRLGKISRLIDVRPALERGVIGQQLNWDRVNNGR